VDICLVRSTLVAAVRVRAPIGPSRYNPALGLASADYLRTRSSRRQSLRSTHCDSTRKFAIYLTRKVSQ